MSSLALDHVTTFPPQVSTSGDGVLRQVQNFVILFGGSSVGRSTAAAEVETDASDWAFVEQTNSGLTLEAPATSQAAAISELRRRSGLTWEQIARLFGVARRSVHFWISGKSMNASNEERLNRLLIAIRYIDRGEGAVTRAALMSAQSDGAVPFDLLTEGRFEDVMQRLGQGRGREMAVSMHAPTRPKPEVKPSPDRLVGALQDTVHKDIGRTKAARSVKVKKSK